VIDEIHHNKAKAEDVKAMNDYVAATEANCDARTGIRKELAKVSTRVIFNTTIGDPLQKLTDIQANKAKSIKEGVIVQGEDSPEALAVSPSSIELTAAVYNVAYRCAAVLCPSMSRNL
jgi:hypothetical protein